MDKTFTAAGTSTVDGLRTYRFANGSMKDRAMVLFQNGHTEVQLHALPRPMTKMQAITFLVQNGVHAVVPTRAADKAAKGIMQLEAENVAQRRLRSLARRSPARRTV